SKIHISVHENGEHVDEVLPYPVLDYFSKPEYYSIISFLLFTKYNELFGIRREIKIAKSVKEKLLELEDMPESKSKKKKEEEYRNYVKRLPNFYRDKYPVLDFYK